MSLSTKPLEMKLTKPTEVPLVVVDTDPGTDDALALFMLLDAHQKGLIQIVGIVTVRGNTGVDNATRNTMRVLDVLNKTDIPVFRGSMGPIIEEPKPKNSNETIEIPYHGWDGFGDAKFSSEPNMSLVQDKPGVLALIEMAQEHKGKLTLICLGPLTNAALAMKTDPEFSNNIHQLFIMGGNYTAEGNITSAAEYNFHCDPEAAHIVLAKTKSQITLVPWETCKFHEMSWEWRHDVLGKFKTPPIILMDKIEKFVYDRSHETPWSMYYLCDSLIAAVMLYPQLVTKSLSCHLTVELHGGRTRGQVVMDHLNEFEHNVKLIQEVDQDMFQQLLLMAVILF
ncbi:hypothetical protein B566_EDAN002013 [Ephemera danica]|nr:hypothetical protein B566_EDAN002013 [Ephemera danica]